MDQFTKLLQPLGADGSQYSTLLSYRNLKDIGLPFAAKTSVQ